MSAISHFRQWKDLPRRKPTLVANRASTLYQQRSWIPFMTESTVIVPCSGIEDYLAYSAEIAGRQWEGLPTFFQWAFSIDDLSLSFLKRSTELEKVRDYHPDEPLFPTTVMQYVVAGKIKDTKGVTMSLSYTLTLSVEPDKVEMFRTLPDSSTVTVLFPPLHCGATLQDIIDKRIVVPLPLQIQEKESQSLNSSSG